MSSAASAVRAPTADLLAKASIFQRLRRQGKLRAAHRSGMQEILGWASPRKEYNKLESDERYALAAGWFSGDKKAVQQAGELIAKGDTRSQM